MLHTLTQVDDYELCIWSSIIVHDLFLKNCTAIVCSDLKTINLRLYSDMVVSYISVDDIEKYDRNTEPSIT